MAVSFGIFGVLLRLASLTDFLGLGVGVSWSWSRPEEGFLEGLNGFSTVKRDQNIPSVSGERRQFHSFGYFSQLLGNGIGNEKQVQKPHQITDSKKPLESPWDQTQRCPLNS